MVLKPGEEDTARKIFEKWELDFAVVGHLTNTGRMVIREKGEVAADLPIGWDSKQIRVGARTYPAASHALVGIYPNPLNPDRYVVFNSSFTFRDYAYLNNARQVPMLPDWAVIDLGTPAGSQYPGKVVAADFFDENWQLKEK